MSVWVLHQPDEGGREFVTMPWAGMPNLSGVNSQAELRALIGRLMPDAPPESVTLRTQLVWKALSSIQPEDLLAVPSPSGRMAFAEVTGPYRYVPAGIDHAAMHVYPVRWFGQTAPLKRFGKEQAVLKDTSIPLWEVENAKLRNAIRNQLPLGYNRFRKWTWLLVLAFVFQLVRMLQRVE